MKMLHLSKKKEMISPFHYKFPMKAKTVLPCFEWRQLQIHLGTNKYFGAIQVTASNFIYLFTCLLVTVHHIEHVVLESEIKRMSYIK
jgi:hypothetical protein